MSIIHYPLSIIRYVSSLFSLRPPVVTGNWHEIHDRMQNITPSERNNYAKSK